MLCGKQYGSWSAGFWRSQLIWIYTVFNRVYIWFILFSKEFIHVYCLSIFRAKLGSLCIICSFGQVNLSLDKYLMTIYLSLDKYQLLFFPQAWLYSTMFGSIGRNHIISESCFTVFKLEHTIMPLTPLKDNRVKFNIYQGQNGMVQK